MAWAEGFIAADWGTTNRRAWRIGADGRAEDAIADDRGVLAVSPGAFPAEVRALRDRLGDLPMLLAGMVGSNRGWVETPYVPAPASLADLASALHWAEPGSVAIVPGVCYAAGDTGDVMRGEEVQILGAVADGLIGGDDMVCHPGTHNKWIRVDEGRIAAFRTVMTGELFNLLKAHSILADLLAEPARADAAFAAGVRHALERDDLTAELFSLRAGVLLGKRDRSGSASYASGLLIGADLRVGLALAGGKEVVVMGRPDLTRLYAAALAEAGRGCRELGGEEAFLAGARRLAELAA